MMAREFDAINLGAPSPWDVLTEAYRTQPGEWDLDRADQLLAEAGFHVRRNDVWGLLRYLKDPPPPASALPEAEPDQIPGQDALPLRPFQPTLWSL
ncbi:hypothetical protein ACWCWD_06500 [Streptomyces sp. NPDC001493]